jgi:predicted Zn-dependent protease
MRDSAAGLLTEPIVDTPIADRLRAALPNDVDYASARVVDERSEHLMVRQNTLEPIFNEFDTGVMISI